MAGDAVLGRDWHDNGWGWDAVGIRGEHARHEVVDTGDVFDFGNGAKQGSLRVTWLWGGGAGAGKGEATVAHDILDHGWGGVLDAHDMVDDFLGKRTMWVEAGEGFDCVFFLGGCGIDISWTA